MIVVKRLIIGVLFSCFYNIQCVSALHTYLDSVQRAHSHNAGILSPKPNTNQSD